MKYKFDYKTIQGYYGGNENNKTASTIYVCDQGGDYSWYAIDGSTNVNHTSDGDKLVDGVWVEALDDFEAFQASKEVTSIEDFEQEIEDYYS